MSKTRSGIHSGVGEEMTADLRRKCESYRRKTEVMSQEREKASGQFQTLLKAFTMQRKALEVSIKKNKRFESESQQLTQKNRELTTANQTQGAQIEQLESDMRLLKSRFRKEREALETELEDKKGLVSRYSTDLKEMAAQKMHLKAQIDEYEAKIKMLISELESNSKNHIRDVNDLHEHYMGFKSSAAELKTRVSIYKQDQERAIASEREAKKEVLRLTFLNDELQEKVCFMERKFATLAKRCGASPEDLEAVEMLIGGNSMVGGQQQQQQRGRSNERGHDSKSTGNQNFNFYPRQQSQEQLLNSDSDQSPKKERRGQGNQQQNLQLQAHFQSNQNGKSKIDDPSAPQYQLNAQGAGEMINPSGQQMIQALGAGVNQNDSNSSMLKKLIENIRTSHALRNEQVRDVFKLSEIREEHDLHKYKNLLNAMAALFFTNHSMAALGGCFQHWQQIMRERRQQKNKDAKKGEIALESPIQAKQHKTAAGNAGEAPMMSAGAAPANNNAGQTNQKNNNNTASDEVDQEDAVAERAAKKYIEQLRKIGPHSKQILNYSYPPLLYQRGEEEDEEGEADEEVSVENEGEGDDDDDEDEDEEYNSQMDDDMGQLPQLNDSDDDMPVDDDDAELLALEDQLKMGAQKNNNQKKHGNNLEQQLDSNSPIDDDDDQNILNRLKSVDHNDMMIGESSPGAPNQFEHAQKINSGKMGLNNVPKSNNVAGAGHNPTSTATQLDDLDRDEVLKMINQQVEGGYYSEGDEEGDYEGDDLDNIQGHHDFQDQQELQHLQQDLQDFEVDDDMMEGMDVEGDAEGQIFMDEEDDIDDHVLNMPNDRPNTRYRQLGRHQY